MSLPVGAGYAEIEWDAPSADVSGFSVILDAETKLGGLTSFTDDINTTDGARGRIAQKSTGDEYAFDWIADDVSTDLGLIRFYADIVLAASGADARTAQIYAPNTRNTAYAAGDTYGQYNAYADNLECYWANPLDLTDRTGSITLTQTGTVTEVDGLLGKAAQTEDTSSYLSAEQSFFTGNSNDPISMFGLVKSDALTSRYIPVSVATSAASIGNYSYRLQTNNDDAELVVRRFSDVVTEAQDIMSVDTWNSLVGVEETTSLRRLYYNGTLGETDTTAIGSIINIATITLALQNGVANTSLFQHVGIYSSILSADFIAYEYSQTSDNSTFLGSPTCVSGSTGATILADIVSMESDALAPVLSAGVVLSSSIQQVDIDALKESFAAGATISPGIQTINVDYLGAILAAGASIPANIQSVDIAPFVASFQTGNSISAELVSVAMTTQQAEFLSGVVATQGLQSLSIDVLTPTFRAETLIIAPLADTTVDTLLPVFDLGGDYIRADLLTVDTGYFAPSFASGAVMASGLQTVEFQFLDATLAELGKITGLMKVSFSGAVPGTDFTGAVPGVILIGEVD